MAIFFDGWADVVRVILIAPCAYTALVLFLRISGKRTLTQLNAFDLVITVSLGSVLATLVLSKDTPLLEGLIAMATLIALPWIVAFISVRSKAVRDLVRSQPTLLGNGGACDVVALRRARVTEDEVRQVVRASGRCAISATRFVFLQTDGNFAIVGREAK